MEGLYIKVSLMTDWFLQKLEINEESNKIIWIVDLIEWYGDKS